MKVGLTNHLSVRMYVYVPVCVSPPTQQLLNQMIDLDEIV
jgi:hypothetical protein